MELMRGLEREKIRGYGVHNPHHMFVFIQTSDFRCINSCSLDERLLNSELIQQKYLAIDCWPDAQPEETKIKLCP